MPPKRRPLSLGETRKKLAQYDDREKITEKARAMAKELGHGKNLPDVYDDFGRTLPYYARIHSILLRYAGKLKGKKLIHLGGSTGLYAKFLQDQGIKAVSFDIGQHASSIARRVGNKLVVRGYAMSWPDKRRQEKHLPFKDNAFDCFVSDHFLLAGFTVNPETLLPEIQRILKPRGIGVIYRIDPDDGKFFAQLLQKHGFKVLAHRQLPEKYNLERNYYWMVVQKE